MLGGMPTFSQALTQEFFQVTQQIEATMKQAAAGTTPDPGQLQAMQGRVAQLMAQYEQTSGAPPPIALPTVPQANVPAPVSDPTAGIADISQWVEMQRAEFNKAEHTTKLAASEGGAFVGIVNQISTATASGIITCADLQGKREGVHFLADQCPDLLVGDTVLFKPEEASSGQQRAVFVRKLGELTKHRQRILEVEAPLPAAGAVESAQEYLGSVTSFQAETGFGFISCPQTRQLYGTDVYIHRDQFADISMGDSVNFRVALNPKGIPVARGVRKAFVTSSAAPSPPSIPATLIPPTIATPQMQPAPAVRPPAQNLIPSVGFRPGSPPPPPPIVQGPLEPTVDVAPPLPPGPPPPVPGPKRARSRSSSMSMSCSRSPTRGGQHAAGADAAPAPPPEVGASGKTATRTRARSGSHKHRRSRERRRSSSRSGRGRARQRRSNSERSRSRRR